MLLYVFPIAYIWLKGCNVMYPQSRTLRWIVPTVGTIGLFPLGKLVEDCTQKVGTIQMQK